MRTENVLLINFFAGRFLMLKRFLKTLVVSFVMFFIFFLGGCAKQQNQTQDLLSDDYEAFEVYDPWEPYNRIVFQFNDRLYNWIFFPISDTYGVIVPDLVKTGIGNFFYNLSAPIRIFADICQGEGEKLKNDTLIFVANSLAGFGFIDHSSNFEKNADDEDISQSLANWGLAPGPYIVWPFFGPSNIRNSLGDVGNALLTPSTYLGFPGSTVAGITEKTNGYAKVNGNPYRTIVEGSIDPYGAIKQAYYDNFLARLDK